MSITDHGLILSSAAEYLFKRRRLRRTEGPELSAIRPQEPHGVAVAGRARDPLLLEIAKRSDGAGTVGWSAQVSH